MSTPKKSSISNNNSLFFAPKKLIDTWIDKQIATDTHYNSSNAPPPNWSYLLPTLMISAAGSLLIPHFAFGLLIGTCDTIFKIILLTRVTTFLFGKSTPEESDVKTINDMIFKSPLTVTLFAPIMEELFFRGIIQPLLLASILTLFPQLTGVVLFGTFSAAGICAVAITAALFGAVHLTNQKKNDAYHQAFNATFGGVVYGLLSLQFNLFTSIAAHVINNTVCITLMMMILSRLQELKADNSNSVSTDQPSLSQCSPY